MGCLRFEESVRSFHGLATNPKSEKLALLLPTHPLRFKSQRAQPALHPFFVGRFGEFRAAGVGETETDPFHDIAAGKLVAGAVRLLGELHIEIAQDQTIPLVGLDMRGLYL